MIIQYRFAVVSMLNAEASNLCSTYSALRPYIKDNAYMGDIKKRPYYMVDSTYTCAANPNSMRDTGPTRNAEYYITDPADDILR